MITRKTTYVCDQDGSEHGTEEAGMAHEVKLINMKLVDEFLDFKNYGKRTVKEYRRVLEAWLEWSASMNPQSMDTPMGADYAAIEPDDLGEWEPPNFMEPELGNTPPRREPQPVPADILHQAKLHSARAAQHAVADDESFPTVDDTIVG